LIEIEDVVEGDVQSVSDLLVIVLQAEAYLENVLGSDEFGGGFFAFTTMKLEKEGFVGKCKLHKVGAIAFLSLSESRFGFGVKAANPCGENFIDRFLALVASRGDVDVVERESGKGG
jgi:hypothetical protein